jgi:hypothetical protein
MLCALLWCVSARIALHWGAMAAQIAFLGGLALAWKSLL